MATLRQAVLLPGADPAPALLRELGRFGVEELVVNAPSPGLAALLRAAPRPLALAAAAGGRHLVCDPAAMVDFNLARLLARPGASAAWRDGCALGVAIHDGAGPPIPVEVPPLPRHPSRSALFLDRDGTINRDHGYVGTRDRWEWMPGGLDAIRLATERGWLVFVVTNQSGIARGLFTEAALHGLHRWMVDQVHAHGGTIDDIRFCPFHPEAPLPAFRRQSGWRKPAPGMLLDLLARWELDPACCAMVGDQDSDLAAAAAAGMRGVAFRDGSLLDVVAAILG